MKFPFYVVYQDYLIFLVVRELDDDREKLLVIETIDLKSKTYTFKDESENSYIWSDIRDKEEIESMQSLNELKKGTKRLIIEIALDGTVKKEWRYLKSIKHTK